MSELKILSTKNYDDFKFVQANRELNEKHVDELTASIKRRNLLAVNPCIVGDDMEVIDGQHRIEAAKRLKETIYYFKATGLTHLDIIALNNVKLMWKTMDYFYFFLIKKYPNYILINEVMRRFGYDLRTALAIFSWDGKPRLRDMKEGVIDVANAGSAYILIAAVEDYKTCLPFYKSFDFTTALRSLIDDTHIVKHNGEHVKYDHDFLKPYLVNWDMGSYFHDIEESCFPDRFMTMHNRYAYCETILAFQEGMKEAEE